MCDGVCVVETDQASRMCSSERAREMEIEAVLAQMAAMILLTKILRNEKSKIVLCALVHFGSALSSLNARLVASLLGRRKKK